MIYKVGVRTVAFCDPNRARWRGEGPRPLVTDLWYPAAQSAVEEDVFLPPEAPLFHCGRAAPDAELAPTPGSFPLILFSHGTGGSSRIHGWLASALARRGYMVAGVNHHGNTSLEPYLIQGFSRVWERPKDLSRVLDCLLKHPLLGPPIQRDSIGAAGFSLGGSTVIALAGGRLDLANFIQSYRDAGQDLASDMPPEFPDRAALAAEIESLALSDASHKQSFRDERIRAVFAIAPALGQGFTAKGLASIQIPVRLVVGEADTSAPPATNARFLARHIPHAELTVIPGLVGHYTFLAEATAQGKEFLPEITTDAPGVNRIMVHQMVSAGAAEFFDRHLVT